MEKPYTLQELQIISFALKNGKIKKFDFSNEIELEENFADTNSFFCWVTPRMFSFSETDINYLTDIFCNPTFYSPDFLKQDVTPLMVSQGIDLFLNQINNQMRKGRIFRDNLGSKIL